MITNMLRCAFFLASLIAVSGPATVRCFAAPPIDDVTLIGSVTCSLCLRADFTPKGFTPLTLAVSNVELGDDVVLVASGRTYKLQGDKELLRAYLTETATVMGRLDGDTIQVDSMDSHNYITPYFPNE